TFSDKTDMSIAVNLGGELIETLSAPVLPEPVAEPESDSIADKISHYIDKLKDKTDLSTGVDWDAYAIANQAFDAMQSTIARQKLAAYPPDQSIIIPRNACSMFDFDRAGEMIELGYNEARKNLTSG
ncbi:MAG: serine protease, partial [Amphritea sp.]|nr:serine protease [Amphritea sp.]